ncbi:hypothetical protein BCL76_101310 [Streptomyces sp. CG 926]|uniref:hypothetical protein n=1 Tax=Streptomyces sp. CG 926 TaxID=1882405 RepID=UPI000D6BB2C6|nr:hypothetical protein [Streptomyces sp. CG 926]PWK74578.1 hypothetical protein BCL76_101310 [Streptomyces sp. CG 926]
MSDGYDRLAETLDILDELLSEMDMKRTDALDLGRLSHEACLRESAVETLLAGRRLPEVEFRYTVVDKIKFLMETRLKKDKDSIGRERLRPYSAAEIARAVDKTPQWLSLLLKKASTPSLETTGKLSKFFDVPSNLLLEWPPETLARILNTRVIPELRDAHGCGTDGPRVPPQAMKLALRLGNAKLKPAQEEALHLFIDSIKASL